MKISDATPITSISDNDLFVVVRNEDDCNSATAQVLKNYFNNNYIVSPLDAGGAGQVLVSNGTGGNMWATLEGGAFITSYPSLTNLPTVNGVSFTGTMTSHSLGLADEQHDHTVSEITDFPDLASVATSGSYNDLDDTPTIPDAVTVTTTLKEGVKIGEIGVGEDTYSLYAPAGGGAGNIYRILGTDPFSGGGYRTALLQAYNDSTDSWITTSSIAGMVPANVSAFSNDAQYVTSTSLASVATSGSYNDLNDTPTIPDAVTVAPTLQEGTKIGEITVGETKYVLFAPQSESSSTYYRLLGSNADVQNSGYKTINLQASADGVTYTTISSMSIPTYISAFSNDANYLSSIPFATVSVGTSPTGSSIVGPTKVVTGAQAVYQAVPATGYKFRDWYIDNSTTSTQNPLTINVSSDISLIARFDATANYTYCLVSDWQQCQTSQDIALPIYTLLKDGEPAATTLYELLQYNAFTGRTAADNIDLLFSAGATIGESVYTCSFTSNNSFDFSQLINSSYLSSTFNNGTKIYLFFKSLSNGVYTFSAYKYIDDDIDNDTIFKDVYPVQSWISLGDMKVTSSIIGWFLAKYTQSSPIYKEDMINILSITGPTTLMQ